ncbi:hypothetical protein ENUP19_0158G0006 [Entamoeba nuttalli]
MSEEITNLEGDIHELILDCIRKLLELGVPSPNDLFDEIKELTEVNVKEMIKSTNINELRDLLIYLLVHSSPIFPEIYNNNAILIMKNNLLIQKHQLRALLYFIPIEQREILYSLFEFLHLSRIPIEKIVPVFTKIIFKTSTKFQTKFSMILSVYIEHYNFMSFQLSQNVPNSVIAYELKARTISSFPPEYKSGFLEVPANAVIEIIAINTPEWIIGRYREGLNQSNEETEICGFIAISFLKLIPEKFTLPDRAKIDLIEEVTPKIMVTRRSDATKSRHSTSLVMSQTIYCEICYKVPIENPSKCEFCAKHIQPRCCYECLISLECLKNAKCPLCGHELNKKSKIIPTNPIPERVITPSNSPIIEKKWKNNYKISVLGITGVGKTSLIVHYVFGKFVEQKDNTIADIYRKTSIVNEVPCLIQISDFDDKKADGFILVYSKQIEKSLEYVMDMEKKLTSKYKRFVIVRNDFKETPEDNDICFHHVFSVNATTSIDNFGRAVEELICDIRAIESRPKKVSKCNIQ